MHDGRIRFATPADAGQVRGVYAPYVIDTAVTFEYEVPTTSEMGRRIARTLESLPWLVYEAGDRVVGYAYASPFHARAAYAWSVETSIYVDRDCRRSGVGRTLMRDLEAILSHMGVLNLNACIAYVQRDDPFLTDDSVRFHERLGFVLTAHFHECGYKFGRWYDMVWMERLPAHRPDVPRPLSSVDEARAWYETACRL